MTDEIKEKLLKEIEILRNQMQKHFKNGQEWGYNLCQKQIELKKTKIEQYKETSKAKSKEILEIIDKWYIGTNSSDGMFNVFPKEDLDRLKQQLTNSEGGE